MTQNALAALETRIASMPTPTPILSPSKVFSKGFNEERILAVIHPSLDRVERQCVARVEELQRDLRAAREADTAPSRDPLLIELNDASKQTQSTLAELKRGRVEFGWVADTQEARQRRVYTG